MNSIPQRADMAAAQAPFERRLQQFEANAPHAPALLQHILAHALCTSMLDARALGALADCVDQACVSVEQASVTLIGMQHIHRAAVQLRLSAGRRARHEEIGGAA